jgi:Cytochrome P460
VHRSLVIAGMICLVACSTAVLLRPAKVAQAASANSPVYLASGEMVVPANYREWVYLSTGLGMSYTAKAEDAPNFDNVFVNPEAYHSFLATGTWPDKTMMVLEVREARDKGSINQHGHFQGMDVMGLEVHVKDEKRFPGKWAFFDFDKPGGNGTLIPAGASCYTCHAAHAAADTTFVQFYPTLLPIAHDKGTLSAEFLKDMAEHDGPAVK